MLLYRDYSSCKKLVLVEKRPENQLQIVKKQLSIAPDHFFIRRTSNRPNITYATRKIVGSLGDHRNLQFILPPAQSFKSPNQIPSTIIFHDNAEECSDAAIYLDNLLPQEYCSTGIIRHYHSNMSKIYLDLTYKAFQAGTCRVLHTCSGMESGIDFNKADVVIQYGTPADGTMTIQRGGCGGRNMKDQSLFLIMYEPWAVDANLDGLPDDGDDPDRPFSFDNKRDRRQSTCCSGMGPQDRCSQNRGCWERTAVEESRPCSSCELEVEETQAAASAVQYTCFLPETLSSAPAS